MGIEFIFSECGDGIISAVLQVTVLIMPVYVLLQSPRLLFAAYMLSFLGVEARRTKNILVLGS